ncbi:MAG: restriction endonuclease subunit S [Denitratisoma sp.]|nr:restriction endonuclease subunit S [Denitratisoma sp.]
MLSTKIELLSPDEQVSVSKRLLSGISAARSALASCTEQEALSLQLQERTLFDCFHNGVPISADTTLLKTAHGWRWHRLTDLARLESGHTPSRRHPEWWGGHVPWLALPDIRRLHGKYAYETTENTNDAGLANSSARLLPPGTVCLCRDASIGYVTILGKPMATSQHFCNWICGPDLDPEFLMYAFMASHEYLRELGSGSVIKTIYMSVIESFHICAPEIDEQRRIARTLRERLAAAETLNASLKARLADIERLPQRLLAAAFHQH